jgi:hypothetical protein
MKTSYTSEQLGKLNLLLKQRGATPERFQAILGSGLISDIFDVGAKIHNRIAIRKALGLGALPGEPGSHIVNYGMSHDDMIIAGNYDWKNDDLTAKRFPIVGKRTVEFEDTLFHFDEDISSEEAVKRIQAADPQNPWEPAKIENLLAYGAKNPEEQRKYPIIALGSVAEVIGNRYVPCLGRGGSRRELNLDWWDGAWSSGFRFLAVRKKKVSQT